MEEGKISLNDIIKAASSVYQVPTDYVLTDTNRQDVVWIRQAVHYWSRMLTRLTLENIGKQVGNRDHATVLHSVKCVEKEYDVYFDRKLFIDSIGKELINMGLFTDKEDMDHFIEENKKKEVISPNKYNRKKVKMTNKRTGEITIAESMTEAAAISNSNKTYVSRACAGKSVGRFMYKFELYEQ